MPCDQPARVEMWAWRAMVARCTNPNHPKWHRYGGRGVRVCARWLASFADFLADMGRRPGPGYSLDRRENDGHYEPGNCRWATRPQQDRNRGDNRIVEYGGLRLPAVEMCERFGADYVRFRDRMRLGWSVARAIECPPVDPARPRSEVGAAAMLSGVTGATIRYRMSKGATLAEAAAMPKSPRGRPRKADR